MESKTKEISNSGMLSLEACISVLMFLMLMLLLSGFFRMFMAQNETAHVALETAESLALDAYSAEKIGNGSLESVGDLINGLFGLMNDENFTSYSDWYSEEPEVLLADVVKKRFVAYLSGGDVEKADQLLERLNVKDGLEGIDFSGSRVVDDILYVNVKYKLKYDFRIGSLGEIDVNQETCAKLWK